MPSIEKLKELHGTQIGSFIVDEYINRGRIGAVFRGHRVGFDDDVVAIKIVFGVLKEGWDTELRKVARLSNIKNVVHFRDLGDGNALGVPVTFTVWHFIAPGRNLKQYSEERGQRCSASFYVALIETVLAVLHAVQTKGVKHHGDLHPGNILIGDADAADINPETGNIHQQIYVADFGYGQTGGAMQPKDDYGGLKKISDIVIQNLDLDTATPSDRQTIDGIARLFAKLLTEQSERERANPKGILAAIRDIKANSNRLSMSGNGEEVARASQQVQVGAFHVSEMLGDNWPYWRELFVATIPKRLGILQPDCQRRRQNASARRSKNASVRLAGRPPAGGLPAFRDQAWVASAGWLSAVVVLRERRLLCLSL